MEGEFRSRSRVTNSGSIRFVDEAESSPNTTLLGSKRDSIERMEESDHVAQEAGSNAWELSVVTAADTTETANTGNDSADFQVNTHTEQDDSGKVTTVDIPEYIVINSTENSQPAPIENGVSSVGELRNEEGQILSNPSLVTEDDLKDTVTLAWDSIDVLVDLPKPPLVKRLCNKGVDKDKLQTKQVLFDVSGKVEPGTLVAVMGASGAGKTTLMNVLAHQNIGKMHVSGIVTINGRVIGKQIKRICAYVQQEDLFIGTLTVKEHLTFQALLRMDSTFTKKQKVERVAEVMSELGLLKCKDTIIGVPGRIRGISGGEMKRLSFASEVITNPQLLFVDEPTSGLDSFMAQSIIASLQRLASSKGRTILATIHQPSSEVFEMFNSILLMSEGRVAYMGTTAGCLDFFQELNYPCPLNYNPADHYIMTLAIIPGDEERCRERAKRICDHFEANKPKRQRLMSATSFNEAEIERPGYKVGFLQQVRYVLWRSHVSNRREPYISTIRIMQQIVIALIAGLVYLRQKNGQASIQNIQGALFFAITTGTFGSLTSSVFVFPAELPVFLKDYRYGMYNTPAYFISKTVAELPYYVFGPALFSIIAYWMVGFRETAGAFFIFLGLTILVNQAALSFGYLVSTISPTVQVATAIGPPLIMPFLLFGGFFLKDESIPDYFIWLKYLSWFKYSFEAYNINQWDGFGTIPCDLPVNSSVPCIKNGNVVLQSLGFDPDNMGFDVGMLFAITFGFRLLAFLVLLLRTTRK